MNLEAKRDLRKLRKLSDEHLKNKYIKGYHAHKGSDELLRMSLIELLENALDENDDQRVYLLKAIEEAEKGGEK
jgi:hypothetical protein